MKKWIFLANFVIAAICLLFLASFFGIKAMQIKESALQQPQIVEKIKAPPSHSFQLGKEAYQEIKSDFLDLNHALPNLSLPDLKNILTYYGVNKRIDADPLAKKLAFSFGDPKQIFTVENDKPTYLVRNGSKFSLSPNNASTSLWFKAKAQSTTAQIELSIEGIDGGISQEPRDRAFFTLAEKPLLSQSLSWNLGKFRVDGTILLKQKAKWFGPDRFLEQHGGEEYASFQGKQRIDFGEGDEIYSVFVSPGDILIWKEDRWQNAKPGKESRDFPVLEIKKVEERLLSGELWDKEGRSKTVLNLLRSQETFPPQDLSKDFAFLGARTKVHFMFNLNSNREIVGVSDWFLLGDDGWQKLKKVRDVDAYIARKIKGPLLVINSIGADPQNRVLHGTLYNASRSEMRDVQIPLVMHPKDKKEEATKATEDSRPAEVEVEVPDNREMPVVPQKSSDRRF